MTRAFKAHWLLSAAILGLAAPAHAQDTQTAQGETSPVEEAAAVDDQDAGAIVVTATRRNQALSDVPLAVSAVTGESLENSGASDIRQLQQLSPALQVSSTQSEAGASTARIRGIGTVGDNPGLESSVAVFIDGVYRARNGTALTELGPIDRIEVLRGPQGTLFGRNASAGIISVITQRPSFEPSVNGELSYGNYDFLRGEVGVTGPLTDGVAFRLDGIYLRRDGFLTDVISGRDLNDRNRYLVRGQLLIEPNDAFSLRVIGDYTERDEECCGATYLPFADVTASGEQPSTFAGILRGLGAVITDDTFAREMSITPGADYVQDVTDWGVSAELNYDFGGARLTSITAYRGNDYLRGQDADYNNLDILRRNSDGGSTQDFRTFTQELRLQGEALDGRLDWLVGGYFGQESLLLRDNLSYGADYERYANCVLLANVLPAAVAPTPTGSCVNVPVIQGATAQLVAQRNALLAAGVPPTDPRIIALSTNIGLLGALTANPARPGFGSIAAALGQPTLGLANTGTNDLFDLDSRNLALFTHNIFEITPDLSLTIGLRYTNERRTLEADLRDNLALCRLISASPLAGLQQLPCVIPGVPGGSYQATGEYEDDAISGTAVLSYRATPRLLTYASYSRGYKSGGFNLDRSALARRGGSGPVLPDATLEGLIFEPEGVDAFELGAKYDGPGIDVNVAAFYQLFDNFQLNTFNGLFFVVENINSCSEDLNGADTDNSPTTGECTGDTRAGVRSMGLEIETFMRPMTDLGVNLGASIVDARYRDNLVGADGRALTSALFQLPGRRMSNSSAFTLTGSLAYTPQLGNTGLSGLFYVDGRYQSEFNTGSDLDIEKIQQEYFVMNARIGVRGADNRWGIELWAQNLLDEDYLQVAFDSPLQGSGTTRAVEQGHIARSTQLFSAFLAEPRTYGITGRFRF